MHFRHWIQISNKNFVKLNDSKGACSALLLKPCMVHGLGRKRPPQSTAPFFSMGFWCQVALHEVHGPGQTLNKPSAEIVSWKKVAMDMGKHELGLLVIPQNAVQAIQFLRHSFTLFLSISGQCQCKNSISQTLPGWWWKGGKGVFLYHGPVTSHIVRVGRTIWSVGVLLAIWRPGLRNLIWWRPRCDGDVRYRMW